MRISRLSVPTVPALLLAAALTAVPVLPAAGATASAPLGDSVVGSPIASSTIVSGQTAPDSAIEWSVVPADAEGEDGRISLRHVVDAGASVADHIAVTNRGAAAAEFTVLAGDGVVGADGAFDIREGEPASSGAWIGIDGLADGHLVLAAGETRVLPVTIAVPGDATPGDHPAGIVVGLSQETGDSVMVTHRIGVRVHLQVAGDVASSLAVTGTEATFTPSWIPFAPGTLVVDVDVQNTGNVRIGAAPVVTAAGAFGIGQSTSADAATELLPGDSIHQRVEMTAWPLAALFGGVTVSGSSIGADSAPPADAVSAEFIVPAISWTGFAVLVLLALVIVLMVRRRRRAGRVSHEESVASAGH